jgi:hypothetical protein
MAKKPYRAWTIHFVALEDFTSPETNSTYLKGLSYRIRRGNDKLHDLVLGKGGWRDQGKVQVGTAPAASVAGTATVKES